MNCILFAINSIPVLRGSDWTTPPPVLYFELTWKKETLDRISAFWFHLGHSIHIIEGILQSLYTSILLSQEKESGDMKREMGQVYPKVL